MKNIFKRVIVGVLVNVFIAFGLQVQSQYRGQPIMDSSIVKKFDAATVSKVFAIAKYTALTKEQQSYLAGYYQHTDSIAKLWILLGRPVSEIDSLQENGNRIFYQLNTISNAHKAEYSNKNAGQFAEVAAHGEMDYIQQEYKPGPTENELINQWVRTKYNFTYQRYLMDKKDAYSPRQSSQLYDLYNFYPSMYCKKFIDDYLAKIAVIKKVPDSTLKKIRAGFLATTKDNKYGDWSKALLDVTRYFLPDTAIFSGVYRQDLARQAVAMSGTDKYDLIYRQHISSDAFATVYNWVIQKNYENALIEYTYGAVNVKMIDSLVRKSSKFYDARIKAALIRDGSLQPATQFAIGLKYKGFLKLSPNIIDSLVYHAMYLSEKQDSVQLGDPFSYIDFGAYESEQLNRLLTAEQYTNLLAIKNRPSAYADAKRDWADMDKRGLTKELDREQTTAEIANYYVARYSAWNRLAHDDRRQTANMKILESVKPKALKNLESARWNDDPGTPSNNLKLQW